MTYFRGQPAPGRQNSVLPPPRSSLPGGATLTAGPPMRNNYGSHRTSSNLTITPSVTITPTSAPPAGAKSRNVSCNVLIQCNPQQLILFVCCIFER